MTPKEKAIQLRDKYIFTDFNVDEDYKDFMFKILIQAKHCALIAVDDIIFSHIIDGIIDYDVEVYWDSVKQEIEKL